MQSNLEKIFVKLKKKRNTRGCNNECGTDQKTWVLQCYMGLKTETKESINSKKKRKINKI